MAEEEPFDAFTLITTSQEGDASLVDKLNKGKEWIQNNQAGTKGWGEFLNIRRLKKPSSMGDATGRLVSNVKHYYMNYLFVFMGLAVYCVITNPVLLFAMALCILTYWYVSMKNKGNNITIVGREFSPAEIYTGMGVVCVPVFYIAGAGSTIFWIIGASIVFTLLHAVMMAQPTSSHSTNGMEELGIIMEDVTVN